jgi:hypothetical protein
MVLLPVGGGGCGENMRVNMVQILCTHFCKWKKMPVVTIPELGIGRDKGE